VAYRATVQPVTVAHCQTLTGYILQNTHFWRRFTNIKDEGESNDNPQHVLA